MTERTSQPGNLVPPVARYPPYLNDSSSKTEARFRQWRPFDPHVLGWDPLLHRVKSDLASETLHNNIYIRNL